MSNLRVDELESLATGRTISVDDIDTDVRKDLANPDMGAEMVAFGSGNVSNALRSRVAQVATIADLLALEPAGDGQQVELLGHTVAGIGGGMFYADYSSSAADDNGVTVVTTDGKRWVRRLDGYVTPEMFGSVGDGVSDDTLFFSTAATSAINNDVKVVKADLSYKLSNFNWPDGIFLRGHGSILDTFSGHYAEVSVSNTVTSCSIKAIYVHDAYSIAELLAIKTLGFNTLVHYCQFNTVSANRWDVLNAASAVGLKVILSSFTDSPSDVYDPHPNLIGYYLFDEPRHHSVSKVAQDARVAAHRAITDKLIVVTDSGNFGYGSLSAGYDIIFNDQYYPDTPLLVSLSHDDGVRQSAILGRLEMEYDAPSAKILPCLGLFTATGFSNKQKQISFAKSFLCTSDEDGSFAVFSWDSVRSEPNTIGIMSDPDLIGAAREVLDSRASGSFRYDYVIFENFGSLSSLVSKLLPAYSNADAKPFSVKNAGSQVDERNSTFTYKGIGFRNSGGTVALDLRSKGRIEGRIFFKNFLDSGSITASIIETDDDFFNTTSLFNQSLTTDTGVRVSTPCAVNKLIGISGVTTSSSSIPWKFLSGWLVSHNWVETSF